MFSPRIPALTIIVLAVIATAGCTLWAKPNHPSWRNATGVEDHERLYWQALKEKNWMEIEAHTASQYTHVSSQGVYDKQKTIEEYKRFTLTDYTLGDFNVVHHGDTAVATYNATFTYIMDGKSVGPVTLRRMSVWQQHKSGWVLVASTDVNTDTNSKPAP